MQRNVIFGPARATSGSSSLRREHVSSSPKPSASVALSQDRFLLVGTREGMAFPMISSHRQIAPRYGPLSAPPRPSICPALPILTSCTSICIPRKSVPALVVVWEVPSHWQKCSRIVVTKRTCRMISFRKRKSLGDRMGGFLSVTFRFINTTAGWINLLLLSSSGPVKIPVGAW